MEFDLWMALLVGGVSRLPAGPTSSVCVIVGLFVAVLFAPWVDRLDAEDDEKEQDNV